MKTPKFFLRSEQTILQPGDQMFLMKEGSFYFLLFKRGEETLVLKDGFEEKSNAQLLYQEVRPYPITAEIGILIAAACGLSVEIDFSPAKRPTEKIEGPTVASIYTFR